MAALHGPFFRVQSEPVFRVQGNDVERRESGDTGFGSRAGSSASTRSSSPAASLTSFSIQPQTLIDKIQVCTGGSVLQVCRSNGWSLESFLGFW